MSIDNLTIKEARELACLFGNHPKPAGECCTKDMGVQIVVLQRGWVCVGHLWQTGDEIKVTKAAVIRLWGTTKGLGQIALEGPQSGTKLDDCGEIRAFREAVILTIPCAEGKFRDRA